MENGNLFLLGLLALNTVATVIIARRESSVGKWKLITIVWIFPTIGLVLAMIPSTAGVVTMDPDWTTAGNANRGLQKASEVLENFKELNRESSNKT